MKPLFNAKGSEISNEAVLLEKDKILRGGNEATKEFHSSLSCFVSSVGVTKNKYAIQKNIPSSEPIDKAINKFQFHPSILLIQK